MKQSIANITLVVRDYDKAIEFYTQKLDFILIEDTLLEDGKRWVLVSPPGSNGCRLLLAKADGEEQLKSVGNQTGGRVGFFLFTDNFERDHTNMTQRGVNFVGPLPSLNMGP